MVPTFSTEFYKSSVFFILVFNSSFVALNSQSVVDLKHFLVVSGVINSTPLLLCALSGTSEWVGLFWLLLANYITYSLILLFFFFNLSQAVFIVDLKSYTNSYKNFFLFIAPVMSLSGAAPT